LARDSGLLQGKQSITVAKVFKRAKKALSIKSTKTGGLWSWSLESNAHQVHVAAKAAVPTAAAPAFDVQEQGNVASDRSEFVTWEQGLAALQNRRPFSDMPRHRWQQFLDNCGAFMRAPEGWPEQAVRLGWNSLDLFGCHRDRPLMYLGSAGLLWAINGGRLIAIRRDWATYETTIGTERVFYRRSFAPDQIVLPWATRRASIRVRA
jgi:hypothetical protein